jgi:hypothetical protein
MMAATASNWCRTALRIIVSIRVRVRLRTYVQRSYDDRRGIHDLLREAESLSPTDRKGWLIKASTPLSERLLLDDGQPFMTGAR